MNLSMKWLADYVDVSDVDIRDYCEKLTYTGSKVEGYEVLGEDIINVVVARIVKMERHPDSDHLFICQVDCGAAAEGIQQIVIEDLDNDKQYGYQLKIEGGKPKLYLDEI